MQIISVEDKKFNILFKVNTKIENEDSINFLKDKYNCEVIFDSNNNVYCCEEVKEINYIEEIKKCQKEKKQKTKKGSEKSLMKIEKTEMKK